MSQLIQLHQAGSPNAGAHRLRRLATVLFVLALSVAVLGTSALGSTQEQENANEVGAWPAESEKEATNLSALSRGFRKDLSGATW
ncbi:MAG: hypothetical protein ACI87O_000662, partial [Planctomycetota bacterium]